MASPKVMNYEEDGGQSKLRLLGLTSLQCLGFSPSSVCIIVDSSREEKMKKQQNPSFCDRPVGDSCRSFKRRCSRLVKEQRARFYILRRCVAMLVCWDDRGDT
ncbi:hypothetical protein NL676_037341 [Syzygium grande]|nr:hypothetical protein NL676_037341 [Syzygium grande]